METFIRSKLTEIFADFKLNIDQLDQLCCLQDLRFNEGHLPDYSDPLLQQLYLLRYFPAYLFEYYRIFKEVIELEHIDTPFDVLSIGTGCGIDYYGLELALQEVNKNVREYVYYKGVDVVPWLYRDRLANPDCRFITKDVNSLNPSKLSDHNIIIFPKSIGEFSNVDYQKLLKLFQKIQFSNSNLILISSIRDKHIDIDLARFDLLLNVFLQEHGFIDLDLDFDYYDGEDIAIRLLEPNFVYPDEIKDFMLDLQDECRSYEPNDDVCSNQCEKQLNKWPILKAEHIKYQIKRLIRVETN